MAESDKNNEELLSLLNSRKTLAKAFGDNYRKEVQKALDDYNIASFDKTALYDIHNRLQIPYIFSTVESGLPSMFDREMKLYMQQGGKLDREFSQFAQQVWEYDRRVSDVDDEIEKAGFMFFLSGLGNIDIGWETETETVKEVNKIPLLNEDGTVIVDEYGVEQFEEKEEEYEVIVKDIPTATYVPYENVFFSPESVFCIDDKSNKKIPYTIVKLSMEKDVAEYIFQTEIEKTEEEELDLTKINKEMDNDNADKLGVVKEDLNRVNVYIYTGWLPEKHAGEKWRPYKVYRAAFTSGQLLQKPYEIDKKTLLSVGNYGSPEEFYRFGEAKALRELEQDVSLGRSVIADYRDRLATKVAVPHGTEFDEESFRSPKQFTVVKFIGDKFPQYITPPPIPETVLQAIGMSRDDIQMTSAQLDISRGSTESVVDTATGQKIFDRVQQERIARKKGKLGKLIIAVAENMLVMSANKWDLETFAKITDMSAQEIEQKGFVEKLASIGTEYDLIIELDDVVNNSEARAAQAIAMLREMKDMPQINQDELIRFAMQVGFKQKDPDRFLNKQLTPEQLFMALDMMVQMGAMPPEMAQEHAAAMQMAMQQQQQGQGNVGRPESQDPMTVAQNSMPGTDTTQITAQNENVDKLMKPKGMQNV